MKFKDTEMTRSTEGQEEGRPGSRGGYGRVGYREGHSALEEACMFGSLSGRQGSSREDYQGV